MGDPAQVADRLLHDRGGRGGDDRVPPPRPGRGPPLHDPDHGRLRGLARRDDRGDAAPGHRADRAQAAGDAPSRPGAELHHGGPHHHVRRPQGLDAAEGGAGHLVPGAQERRRHPRHAAAGRRRPGLQRRFRRHVRHHLRLHRRRVHAPRAAQLRRGHALAAARGAGRHQDRDPRRPGRADLPRVLHRAARGPRPHVLRPARATAGAEPRPADRRPADRRGADLPARGRRLRVRGRHQGGQPGGGRPPGAAPGHRRGPARVLGSAAAALPRERQAGDRARHRDARGRRHPRARREPEEGNGGHPGEPAARRRAVPRLRPGGRRRPRDQRLHDLAVAGDPHHPRCELRQPRRPPGLGRRPGDPADAWRSCSPS